MDLINVLGALQPQAPMVAQMPMDAMPQAPMGPDLNAALATNALRPAPPKPRGGFFRQGGTFANVLGAIGDALLVHSGRNPVYGPSMQRKRSGQALANYLGNLDPGLAELMQEDPATAFEIYKLKHPQPHDKPSFVEEYEYRNALPEDQRKSFDEYANMRKFNPFAAPITLGPNDTYEAGGQPAEAEQVAVNPQTGEKVRFNPQSGQWEPMGGPTDSPSGGFPE